MRKMIDIESRYKKKIVRNYICDVMDFFDRIIYLLELSIHNILAILSIPMFIVGMSGGVYAYKMIMDICKMGRSENIGVCCRLFEIYMEYMIIKSLLEKHMKRYKIIQKKCLSYFRKRANYYVCVYLSNLRR